MLSLVMAVTGNANSLSEHLEALQSALDQCSARTEPAELLIFDCTAAPEVDRILSSTARAMVFTGPPFNPAAAWWNGAELAKGDAVWFGFSDSDLDAGRILAMYDAALRGEKVVLSNSERPTSAIYRADALEAIGGLYPSLDGRVDPSEVLSSAAAAAAAAWIEPVVQVNTAVVEKTAVAAEASSPGFAGASIQVTNPDCFQAGLFSYAGENTRIVSRTATAPIRIGKYCSIASEVALQNGGSTSDAFVDRSGNLVTGYLSREAHRFHSATSFPLGILVPEAPYRDPPEDGSVINGMLDIGHDVWIGYRATVFGPVKVGNGAQIGVGAVVLNDVPPYSVVVGNPAKVVRMRFSKEVVERLERLAWWDWPPEKVLDNWEWFTKPIHEFLDHFDS